MTIPRATAIAALLLAACYEDGGGTTTAGAGGSGGEPSAGGQGTGNVIASGGSGGSEGGGGEGGFGVVIGDKFGRVYGQTGFDAAIALDIAYNDEYLVAGVFEDAIDFGAGPLTSSGGADVFVARFDPHGAVVWQRSYGTSADEQIYDQALDLQGNVFVIGSFVSTIDLGGGPLTAVDGDDLFVLKLDPNGDHLASARFSVGLTSASGADVSCSADPSGNLIIAGSFADALDIGGAITTPAGQVDVYVAKLSPTLAPIWTKQFGSTDADQLNAGVSADSLGNIAIAGTFHGDIAFGGTSLSTTGHGAYLAKLNTLGDDIFSYELGQNCYGGGIVAGHADEIIVVGSSDAPMNVGGSMLNPLPADSRCFVAKYHPAGAHIWSRGYGCVRGNDGPDVWITLTGTVLAFGSFDGVADFGAGSQASVGPGSGFVMGIYSAGSTAFSRVYGSPAGLERVTGGGQDSSGHFLDVGLIRGDADLGMGLVTHAGGGDAFVVRWKP